MIEVHSKAVDESLQISRVIGTHGGKYPGPNVIFVGGMHGNEPAGVFAINQVLDSLRNSRIVFKGKMYGVAGNLEALSQGVRFIDEDLNRLWAPNGVREKQPRDSGERTEIINLLEEILTGEENQILVFDLHTTSASSVPFIAIGDTIRNRRIASQFPVHIVLGLEEHMRGTLFSFLSRSGISSVIFEAGQHDDPVSIKNHITFIWRALAIAGCIEEKDLPKNIRKNIFSFRSNIFETIYRYDIHEGADYVMKPGFKNFDEVHRNQLVSKINGEDILCPVGGKIFLPLYQSQGKDGFFVVRRVKKFWVLLSATIRRLGLDRKMYLFPGVSVHPKFKSGYLVDLSRARWLARQIFHLLGFRMEKLENNMLEVKRREFDFEPPENKVILERIKMVRDQLP